MHDAFMPIGIRTTLTDSQMFQVASHIVGLVILCAEMPIHLLSMHQTYSLLICTKIPCRGSHCLNKFIVRKWTCEVCVYTLRRLQQTTVSCKRSNCNNPCKKS